MNISRQIFSDNRVKEVLVTPGAARIVRQASEGERGAHVLLRQARFPIAAIDPAMVLTAIEEADAMSAALDWSIAQPRKLSA